MPPLPDTADRTQDHAALAPLVADLMDRARTDLAALVAHPSVHGAPGREQACADAAQWVVDAFTEAGVPCSSICTVDGSHAVIGHHPGPEGSPTVLLYAHHDVQPADDADWASPPFTLTDRDGRWYGRGASDCKGNVVAHLTALRALTALDGDGLPCGVRVVVEGSEEAGGEGLDRLARDQPSLFDADVILICDTGNVAAGTPTLTTSLRGVVNVKVTVETLESRVHSGQFGGAAPDALAALIAGLASLRDAEGDTTIDGLPATATFDGAPYDPETFRSDATVLDGVDVIGSGAPADMVWARPAVTVIGLDAPATAGAASAIAPRAAAMLNLRVPPGVDPIVARDALADHLRAHIPWNARVTVEPEAVGAPFAADTTGPGYRALTAAMEQAYGAPVVRSGQGGSIPLCTVLSEISPDAEIALLGVEEPRCRIHAADESVDPDEIARTALSEALFLRGMAGGMATGTARP
ncbi:dipeptidase [Williamsia deligens]|uniref:Dipeptidase n=1 Tax=Williamsia deligens TaxID=321325 RepID=A0ABW3G7L7_9NOCA|nr:dipeptidase [Williamsia deligens]MCP2193159.1 Acetylornithine deacetylase/Succinyl-diaminopimelate desuccinylase [Williamsia deligens]